MARKSIAIATLLLALSAGTLARAQGLGEGLLRGQGEGKMVDRALALLDNDRVRTMLGLTDDQVSRLRDIAVKLQKSAVETRAQMEVLGIELRELLRTDKPDRDAVLRKADQVSGLTGQMIKQHVEALLAAKDVLTPEQQKKIRQFIENRQLRDVLEEFRGERDRGTRQPGSTPAPHPPAPPQ